MGEYKENYFKLYNGRNQLLLVTPYLSNVLEFLNDALDTKLDYKNFGVPWLGQRFIEGYRIVNLKM